MTAVTVHARIAAARERLRRAGLSADEAELSARVIAEHVLGWDAAGVFTSGREPEPPGFAAQYAPLIERRAAREPTAYITGQQEFWGLVFEVSPAVLIPRPETELIVETALGLIAPPRDRTLVIADVCTGSGCLAVSLARELTGATLIATDLSPDALAMTRRNAVRHDVAARVRLIETNLLDRVDGPFDLIVCNPPYVPTGDRDSLQPEVRDHEPPAALFGGPAGLDLIERLLEDAPARLRSGAALVFEFGFGQGERVRELIGKTAGLRMVDLRRDLQGIERVAVVERA